MGRITVQGESRDVSLLTIYAEPKPVICNTLLHVSWKRKIVTESRLAICQIRDNFAEKNPEIPKTIRNQRLLVSVRRKSITGNDCRDKKAGWE